MLLDLAKTTSRPKTSKKSLKTLRNALSASHFACIALATPLEELFAQDEDVESNVPYNRSGCDETKSAAESCIQSAKQSRRIALAHEPLNRKRHQRYKLKLIWNGFEREHNGAHMLKRQTEGRAGAISPMAPGFIRRQDLTSDHRRQSLQVRRKWGDKTDMTSANFKMPLLLQKLTPSDSVQCFER